jgi:proteasome lid subunit RPN8/RPN11
VLRIPPQAITAMIAHCLDSYPLEACGLFSGTPDGTVDKCHPVANVARSARLYEVEPRGLLLADREAEASGRQILGVFHSHTHTDARPSPTDVAQAPDPEWHYVVVSFRDVHPSVRSWRIIGGKTLEEPIVLQW